MKEKYIKYLKETNKFDNIIKSYNNNKINFLELEKIVMDNDEISFNVFSKKEKVERLIK